MAKKSKLPYDGPHLIFSTVQNSIRTSMVRISLTVLQAGLKIIY